MLIFSVVLLDFKNLLSNFEVRDCFAPVCSLQKMCAAFLFIHGLREASLRRENSTNPIELGSAACNVCVAGFKENNVEPN